MVEDAAFISKAIGAARTSTSSSTTSRRITRAKGDLTLDLSGVTDIDTAGVWLLCRLKLQEEAAGRQVRFEGTNPHIDEMIEEFSEKPEEEVTEAAMKGGIGERIFAPVGKMTMDLWNDLTAAMYILGSAVRGAQMKFGRGSGGIRPASIVHQIDQHGRAAPFRSSF